MLCVSFAFAFCERRGRGDRLSLQRGLQVSILREGRHICTHAHTRTQQMYPSMYVRVHQYLCDIT